MNNKNDGKELNDSSICSSGDENQNNTIPPDIIRKEYRMAAQLTGRRKFILIAMTLMWFCFVAFAMIYTIKSKSASPAMNKEIKLFTILPYLNILAEGEKSNSKASVTALNVSLLTEYGEKLKEKPDNEELQIRITVLQFINAGKDGDTQARDSFEKYRDKWKNRNELSLIFQSLYFYEKKPEISKSDASLLETEINETMTGWVKDYTLFRLYSFSGNDEGKKNIILESEKKIYSMGPGLLVFAFLIVSSLVGSILLLYFAVISLWRAIDKAKGDAGGKSAETADVNRTANMFNLSCWSPRNEFFAGLFNFFTFDPNISLEGRGIWDKDNLKFLSMIFWKAWLSFLVWEFSRNIIQIIVMLWLLKFKELSIEGLVLLSAVNYSITVWFVFTIFRLGPEKFDLSKIGIRKIPFLNRIAELIMGAGGYCCALPLVISGALIYRSFTGSNPVSQNSAFNFMDKVNSPLQIGVLFLLVGVIGPIFEEFLFRGVLYTSLRRHLSAPASIFLVSFLFAFIHFDPNVMIGLFILGMVMNVLYEKTGSLVPSIITHCLWNSVTFFLYISLYT